MEKYIIFGVNELSEIVTIYINSNNEYNGRVIGFVVDDEYYNEDMFCMLPTYKYSEIGNIFNKKDVKFLICVGYSQMNETRKNIFYRLKNEGWKIGSFNYFSPGASIAGKVNIEDNCFLELILQ